ncbi:hypothetical protein AXG93_3569s1020 [Marchantia polymorpha subsp. ruderalis]|uniref:Uncharacterized protein n=1 Tax=Marchantia polymorpha subsp. ruderalis TaxID=1480154 RepID=A0A176WHM1_MARPO|nr:hypothetical protein AXG93_3569s1020 [Marchantia polymorpha subsp. ruderalis]
MKGQKLGLGSAGAPGTARQSRPRRKRRKEDQKVQKMIEKDGHGAAAAAAEEAEEAECCSCWRWWRALGGGGADAGPTGGLLYNTWRAWRLAVTNGESSRTGQGSRRGILRTSRQQQYRRFSSVGFPGNLKYGGSIAAAAVFGDLKERLLSIVVRSSVVHFSSPFPIGNWPFLDKFRSYLWNPAVA